MATNRSEVYEYNEKGSPLQVGDLSYTYDEEQRPTRIERFGQLVAEYAYNPFGERVKKTVYEAEGNTKTTYYLYDGSTLTGQIDGDGVVRDQYIYLESYRPVARLSGTEIQAIHADHLGAPRLMTDEQGQTIWKASYSPFGQASIVSGEVELNLRLAGQYLDAESGLHYNYHRYYDPATGRYQTSDPMGLEAGLNTYGYVGGNPLSWIDPKGLMITSAVGGGLLRLGGSIFFLDTASASGLLARFVAGVAATAASPAVITGTVIAVAALGVYYATLGGEAETSFTTDMGGAKPTASDFAALEAQMDEYQGNSTLFAYDRPSELSWANFFAAQDTLLRIQRHYVDGHAGCSEDDHDAGLLATAMAAVKAADDAAAMGDEAATATSAEPPPNCEEEGKKIREALYDNKYDRINAQGKPSGGHGYLRRLVEQICGAFGPGTDGWRNHIGPLVGERNRIREAYNEFEDEDNDCDITDHVSRADRTLAQRILNQDGWTPETVDWLGRDDPRCADFDSISRGNSLQNLIDKVIELTGG